MQRYNTKQQQLEETREKYNRLMSQYSEELSKKYQIEYQGGNIQEQERIIRELKRKMEETQREIQQQQSELQALIEEVRR